MTESLTFADVTRLAELIRSRDVSPVEIMQAHLDRIEETKPKLNAIVTQAQDAFDDARAAEAAVLRGDDLGPLHGVPFTVKDSIDTAGVMTQRGSPIFRGRVPTADATVVARMKAAGAILLAKTNVPEFAYWTETDNLLTGRTNNPWNLDRTPGGSSGGESAAIAAGLSPLGLGSDVAISLRGPAAHTVIVAIKATHGRIPMTGLFQRRRAASGMSARWRGRFATWRVPTPSWPDRTGWTAMRPARWRWAPAPARIRTARSASACWSNQGSASSTPMWQRR